MTPDQSRQQAEHWNKNHWPAQRHVKLFNRIGRKRWMQAYNCKEFIDFIGIENWDRLKMNMKKIMDGGE